MVKQKLDEEAIFKVAREIKSPETQAVYLQQICGDNAELLNRVAALLRVQAEQPSFLESPAASIVTVDQPDTEQLGERIGPYKLLQELGEALSSLALAEMRAGRFELAIQHFQESNTLPRGEDVRACNFFGLAIIHHRLGQLDAAREFLAQGRQLFQQAHPTRPGGTALTFTPGEWIAQQVLSREAEALIASPAVSTGEAAADR